MYIPNYPEDSILSRHFEAAVELKRQMWLQTPPSDSVLRRHAMILNSHPTSRSNVARKRVPAAPAGPRKAPEEKGFMAWLFGLFTRKS
jgi:hypothetical protein